MRGAIQFGRPKGCGGSLLRAVVFVALTTNIVMLCALPSAAQWGPPSTTTIGGHFLAPAPSVTSIAGRHMPATLPSVTSIPNYGWGQQSYYSYYNGRSRGRGYGYGYGRGGLAYSIPYYIPLDAGGYDYDYVGGPPLYSGPPISNDSVLHIIVEQPPSRAHSEPDDSQAYAEPSRPMQQEPASPRDAKPLEPTVLVFRDGHQQEVTNYAIMGQTVYVFDQRTQKIALTDLDVAATIKANDDRGLDFQLPKSGKG